MMHTVLFLLLGAVARADVLVLTTKSMESELSSAKGATFVKFYAPWCGHCKKLAPLWDELASRDLGDVRIGRVDCTRDRPLCKEYGIGGYPMLLLVTAAKAAAERKLYRYSGRRTLDALAAFATGGWQGQEEYDPTKQPEPKPTRYPWSALSELVGRNLQKAACLALGIALCVLFAFRRKPARDLAGGVDVRYSSPSAGQAARTFGNVPLSQQGPARESPPPPLAHS